MSKKKKDIRFNISRIPLKRNRKNIKKIGMTAFLLSIVTKQNICQQK